MSSFGDLLAPEEVRHAPVRMATDVSKDEVIQSFQQLWDIGGARFLGAFADTLINPDSNATAADFVRDKIRSIVTGSGNGGAAVSHVTPYRHEADLRRYRLLRNLQPSERAARRRCKRNPIEAITETGLRTTVDAYEFDVLVLATGFDAMTGALLNMDIRGLSGRALADKWAAGPRSYLGLSIAGFPNLFTVTGPGSPSVLSNMMVSIEQHVDWITDCLTHMRDRQLGRVEANPRSEEEWVDHVNEVANTTLFPKGGSWYLGANVPGKPSVFMPYAGGVGPYREICDNVTRNGYEGFEFS